MIVYETNDETPARYLTNDGFIYVPNGAGTPDPVLCGDSIPEAATATAAVIPQTATVILIDC